MSNFSFDVAPLELILRALLAYSILLLMMRVTGKRTVGQFTPFDLLVVMLVSEAAGPSMTGGDQSPFGGLLVCLILLAMNAIVGTIVAKSRFVEKIFEGEAILIGRNGIIFNKIREKHRISQNDIETAFREADCEMSEMECMFLESNGSLTIKKISA